MGLDPTPTELNGIGSIANAADWAGVIDTVAPNPVVPLRSKVLAALGTPTLIRDIAMVSRTDWDAAIATVTIPDAGGTEGPLSITHESRVESFRRVCRLRAGLAPGDTPLPTAPPTTGTGATAASPSAEGRNVKLSSVLDQTLDVALVPIAAADIRVLFADYKNRRGAYPAEDAEPTSDQLSAIKQVVRADAPPYADFSIFGPHGKRLLRKLMFTAWEQMPNGQWHKKELPGPPNLDGWWAS